MKIIILTVALVASYCIGIVIQIKRRFKKEYTLWNARLDECIEENATLLKKVRFYKKHLNMSNIENQRLRDKIKDNKQHLELLRKRIRHSFCK